MLELRTHDERHPNFCRDLVREPLTEVESDRLRAWQESHPVQPQLQTLTMPERRCAVCKQVVGLLRRLNSTTCSSQCAATLRKRTQRRKAA
jgi:predicted nucleic acid-binding Zn ribbon protein